MLGARARFSATSHQLPRQHSQSRRVTPAVQRPTSLSVSNKTTSIEKKPVELTNLRSQSRSANKNTIFSNSLIYNSIFSKSQIYKSPLRRFYSTDNEKNETASKESKSERTVEEHDSHFPARVLDGLIDALLQFERMAKIKSLTITQELISLRLKLQSGLLTHDDVRTQLALLLKPGQSKFNTSAASSSSSSSSDDVAYFGEETGGHHEGGGGGSRGSSKAPIHVIATTQLTPMAKFFSVLQVLFWIVFLYLLLSSQTNILGMNDEPYIASTPDTNFDSVIGNEEAKEDMQDIVDYLSNPTKFTKYGAKLPKGVLLTGPPGCGKTLLSRALAGEAGVPFIVASGSEFEEMFVGVGARRIRKLFKKAKELSPCVVFIDEIDVIGANRDNEEYKSRYTLQQLLVELDGFQQNSGVMIVAATNKPEILDPALTRSGRFDRRVEVSPPDMKARKEIIELYLDEGDEDLIDVAASEIEVLAKRTTGFSGADLFNLVNTAKIEAAKSGSEKVTSLFLYKAREIIAMGRERRSMILSEEEKRTVAFHESGHTLVGLFSEGSHPVEQVTMIPRGGGALGFTEFIPKEDAHLRSKTSYLSDIAMSLGGRVAEELTFGKSAITQGAGDDLQKATNIARTMVERLGMSEKVGLASFDSRHRGLRASPGKQEQIDEEVNAILQEQYEKAKNILKTHSVELDRLANALLEYETLTADEIQLVIAGHKLPRSPLTKPPPTPHVPSTSV